MAKILFVSLTLLSTMVGFSFAQTSPPTSMPSSITTRTGQALVTGDTGSTQTIMIPGSAAGGLLLNNGNGTSTIMVPGGLSQVVPTPR